MEKQRRRLEEHVNATFAGFSGIDDRLASVRISDDKWSVKDIFGHLIDSAANNYQRFIRLQETRRLRFPGYDYNWIKIVKYNSYPFRNILEMWRQHNLLLCHIITEADVSSLENIWDFEGRELSLEFLISDYIDHMELHLDQLELRYSEVLEYTGKAEGGGRIE